MATFTGKRGLHGVVNVGVVAAFTGKRGLHGVANVIPYEGSPLDSLILFPPGASSLPSSAASVIQLGSWLMADPGADYGAKGLIRSIESGNALVDGGLFGNRYAPVRKMAIPLILNSAAPATSPALWEAAIVRAAMPGAMIAIVPEATATRQEVFFDVIDGRWEPDYNTFHNRVGVRKGTLYLDTQPYGYWPTEILLASSASVGRFGTLAVNGASVIGDVSPLAHVQVSPVAASQYMGGGAAVVALPDMIGVSFSGHASFLPYISPASIYAAPITLTNLGVGFTMNPTVVGDMRAPASQAIAWTTASSAASGADFHVGWTFICHTSSYISSALEPAYRGRFRAFALMRMAPSANPFAVIADAERAVPSLFQSLASANQLATAYTMVAGGNNGSAIYPILDMGEITLPPSASGLQGPERLRLWLQGSQATGMSPTFSFGGFYLLPVDGAAGILTRGAVVPTLNGGMVLPGGVGNNATSASVDFNAQFAEGVSLTTGLAAPGAQPNVLQEGMSQYRGVPLRIGASTTQLSLIMSDRLVNGFADTDRAISGTLAYAQVSVSYRPLFQFMYGI